MQRNSIFVCRQSFEVLLSDPLDFSNMLTLDINPQNLHEQTVEMYIYNTLIFHDYLTPLKDMSLIPLVSIGCVHLPP